RSSPFPYTTLFRSASGHFRSSRFKLRLDEYDGFPPRPCQGEDGGKRDAQADEGDVADDEVRSKRQLVDVTRIRPLEHDDARIAAKLLVQLPPAHVEGNDARRAAL